MKLRMLQFIRGGQIFDYNTKMMVQVSNRIFIWAVLGYFLLSLFLISLSSLHELRLLAIYYYSKTSFLFGYEHKIIWHDGLKNGLSAEYISSSILIKKAVNNAWNIVIKNAVYSGITGGFIYVLVVYSFTRFFIKKGEKYSADKYISGTRLVDNKKELIKSIKKSSRGISDVYLLKNLPLPSRSEFQGFFFHGSTGSGKTQAIMYLLDEIRALGEPAIIYDKECTIKPFFFNANTDVELNPVSALCANWDLWAECDNPLELGNLATYLIPKSVQGSDPFWVDAARTILTSMAWKIRDRKDKSAITLLRLLLTTTLDEMRELLKGTESENLVSKEIEKTAISIKSVLATYTKALRYLESIDTNNAAKFSIKEWIRNASETTNKSNGWLFITSRSKYHREIKPLISLWLGLAMQGIQSLKPNSGKRIWLIIDELASLQRLEMLSDTLADIRKFGGCVAVGIQSIAQLEFLYGNQEAHAVADLLNTSVYFRSPKSRVAKWVSDDLGEQVLDEVRESQSYGPNSIRDGNTIGTQRVVRKTVDAGSIMLMEDLECYVRVVGDHPIAKFKINYIERKELIEPLIERKIDFDALEKINQAAAIAQNHPDVAAEVRKIQSFEDSVYAEEKRELLTDKEYKVHASQRIEESEASLQYEETRY